MATPDELRIAIQKELYRGADMITEGSEIVRRATDDLSHLTVAGPSVNLPEVVNIRPYTRADYKKILKQNITWEKNPQDISQVDNAIKLTVHKDVGGSSHVMLGGRMDGRKTASVFQTITLPEDFEYGNPDSTFKGGKVGFGLAATNVGNKPGGGNYNPDGFTLRTMWRQDKVSNQKPVLVLYSYTADDPEIQNRDTYSTYEFTRGVAHELETRMRINDENKANGWFELRAGGDLIARRDNVLFMQGVPTIDEFLAQFFYGGNNEKWSPTRSNSVVISDVRIV